MAHLLTKDEIFMKKRTFLLQHLNLRDTVLLEDLLGAGLIIDTQYENIQVDSNCKQTGPTVYY